MIKSNEGPKRGTIRRRGLSSLAGYQKGKNKKSEAVGKEGGSNASQIR